jgi:hypothetical protein
MATRHDTPRDVRGGAVKQEGVIPRLDLRVATVTLVGVSQLIVGNASLYQLPEKAGGGYGYPAAAFKQSMVEACRFVGWMSMCVAAGSFHVDGVSTVLPAEASHDLFGVMARLPDVPVDLVKIEGPGPQKREDAVRIGGKAVTMRTRDQFDEWRVELSVRYNADVITEEQIRRLAAIAGTCCGVGQWRPAATRRGGGIYGRFRVDDEENG